MSHRKVISVIVPAYNEAPNLKPLYHELEKNFKRLPYAFEVLFVDDGSQDDSARILCEIAEQHSDVNVIQFARNFGKEAAVSAGLHAARGEAAIVLDADMQMPPSLIGEFLSKWEKGAEVVVGVFSSRSMQFAERVGASMFYRIMKKIGHTKITPHATDYRLLDRQVIDIFNSLPERNRITRGLIDWIGFHRAYVHFEQAPRLHGKPTYSFRKRVTLAMNSFTAYSLLPLRLAGYLGVVILVLSVPLGIFLLLERFAWNDPFGWAVSGTAFLAIMILFLVGVVLVCLGLISMYIAHIHAEVIDRPLYIARRKPKPLPAASSMEPVEEASSE